VCKLQPGEGRVERANRTLQDRLVKELRLASICNIDAGNTFLTRFLDRFNQRFAIPPAKPEDVTGHLILQRAVLATFLCHREQRYVGAQLSFHDDRKQIILDSSIERQQGRRTIASAATVLAVSERQIMCLPRRSTCQPHGHR
jgi:hypothetical protein